MSKASISPSFFFFNDTATTEIYTLSLHDALPILSAGITASLGCKIAEKPPLLSRLPPLPVSVVPTNKEGCCPCKDFTKPNPVARAPTIRSEEHTSELQSQSNLVCRLLLEKKNKNHAPPLPPPSHIRPSSTPLPIVLLPRMEPMSPTTPANGICPLTALRADQEPRRLLPQP